MLLLAACPAGLSEPERYQDPRVAFSCDESIDIKRDIMMPKCGTSGCHAAVNPQFGLDLETEGEADRMFALESLACQGEILLDDSRPLVTGYFFDKMTDEKPRCGDRMPRAAPPLTDAELDCLRLYFSLLRPGAQ